MSPCAHDFIKFVAGIAVVTAEYLEAHFIPDTLRAIFERSMHAIYTMALWLPSFDVSGAAVVIARR